MARADFGSDCATLASKARAVDRDAVRRLKELEKANARLNRLVAADGTGHPDPAGGGQGGNLSPARRRRAIEHVTAALRVSERHACRVVDQHRSTQGRPAPPNQYQERLGGPVTGDGDGEPAPGSATHD